MPCPALPERPQRSLSNAESFSPNSAYAPLDIHTREQAGVYQTVATPAAGKKKGVEKKMSGGGERRVDAGSSAGLYQPLGQNKDSPSAYAVSEPQPELVLFIASVYTVTSSNSHTLFSKIEQFSSHVGILIVKRQPLNKECQLCTQLPLALG